MTKTLGVTGGIGCGKSTVCDILDSFGARIFEADIVGKNLMTDSHEVRQAVTDTFGVDSYSVAGDLDTAYLAEEVFADPERLRAINAIVHPRVLDEFRRAKRMARRDGLSLLVLEAALMYESGADDLVDAVAMVDAPPRMRIQRVVERDGVDHAAVKARMQSQMSPATLRRNADFIIRNTGTLEDLREDVAALFRKYVVGD